MNFNPSPPNFNSFGSQVSDAKQLGGALPSVRKSLKDLYEEKRREAENDGLRYGGIANQILRSPFKAQEIK